MLLVLIKSVCEALLMSTHNICFPGEKRKVFSGYPLVSGVIANEYLQLMFFIEYWVM